jgi:uncharacterized protein YdaU (DUF1376 family)
MSLPWHARNHQDALDGMLMLTLEERGAYNTCLDLIYSRSGPIPDDARWLSGWMGVSLRRWTTIRASLLVKAKLYEVNINGVPSLMNQRAAIELETAAKRQRNLAESGAKGGRKSAETRQNTSKNNGGTQAPPQAPVKLYTETDTEQKNPIEPNGSIPPKRARASRRCPESWQPRPQTLARLTDEGFSPGDLERAMTRMRDHEFRSARTDWDAALRNWVREDAARRITPNDRPHPASPDAKLAAKQANYDRAWNGSERAFGRDREP